MPYAASNADLLRLVGGDAALVTRALETAQGEMFDAFHEGGYAVPPDTSLITDADVRANLESMLETCNEALAAWHLTQHLSDASDKIKEQAAFWRAWLLKIQSGSLLFPELERDTAGVKPAFAIAGDTLNVFTDRVFDSMRTLTGDVS